MDTNSVKSDFKRELRQALLSLRGRPILHDFVGITLLFLVCKLAAGIILTFIDTRGFRAIHSTGTSYDKRIPTSDIPFYQSLASQPQPLLPNQEVTISDIASALNNAHPEVTPDILQFSFETAPLLSWLMSALILCAYALPLVYFILNIANDAPRPILKRIIQVLVILGGATWVVSLYANGHWVRTPVSMVESASFWLIQGALCLHLFTDVDSKARRNAQPLAIAAILIAIGTVNLVVTGQLFGRETGLYLTQTEQIHNAITSGWWASIYDGLRVLEKPETGWAFASFFVVFIVGDLILEFILKRQPLLRALIRWVFIALLLVIGCIYFGVTINKPSQVLVWQAVFFATGMGCLRDISKKTDLLTQARAIIDHFLGRLDDASPRTETEG